MWPISDKQALAYVSENPEVRNRLTEREYAVWVAHRRDDPSLRLTYRAMATIYDITPGRVRQIDQKANRKIHAVMYRDERKCPHCAGRGWMPDATT